MENQAHLPILKRVGYVLIAVGLVDIAWMVYCIAYQVSYSSNFNIFAIIAGIFLVCGSLRAASVVRWFNVFALAASVAATLAFPFLQPLGLTITQLHLYPFDLVTLAAFMMCILWLLYWVAKELEREPVRAAQARAGRKQQDLRIPAIIGAVLVIVLVILMSLLLRGESAEHAKSLAKQEVGPGYRFHVTSLNIFIHNHITSASGMVTAWNDKEIKHIPVHWEDR